jgi:lysophospholipase L1-like esterase/pimeloyl-ACP methyl ester carboxylesterase
MRFLILFLLLISLPGFSQKKIRIACVGNSITHGTVLPDREKNSYPAQLAVLLGDGYDVKNFGKSGATLLRKGNLPYWTSTEYQQALAFQPDWVFIKLGTNDSKPMNRVYLKEYEQDYKDLIASFQQLPNKPRVVLLTPVPVFSTDSTGITASAVDKLILPGVRKVAYETGCEIINLYNLFLDSKELVPDKVHPNVEGTARIAKRISEVLNRKEETGFDLIKNAGLTTQLFNFYGFQGHDFTFQGHNAKIVTPKRVAPGHPWVWRARFWGHEPQTDIAMLERGFHVVYCDVAELFGNDEAIATWDAYYQTLTKAGLAPKAAMEGMSRGGVYIYRWGVQFPDRVAAIYADAPVLDLKSWPGGKGKGQKGVKEWEQFKQDFNLKTDEEALAFKGSPIDLTNEIVKAGFPLLHVVGDADEAVPVDENTNPFEQKIKAAGGRIEVIHKPGIGHHPHSLPNPQPIVDFFLKATGY